MQIIKRQMKPYVLAWQKSLQYLESIEAEQDKLDSLVFELYNLDEKDIELVESTYGAATLWNTDSEQQE